MSAGNSFINVMLRKCLLAFTTNPLIKEMFLIKIFLSRCVSYSSNYFGSTQVSSISFRSNWSWYKKKKVIFSFFFFKNWNHLHRTTTKTWNCFAGNATKQTTTILTRSISSQCHLSWKPLVGKKLSMNLDDLAHFDSVIALYT